MIDISVEDLEGRTEKEEIWKFVEHLAINLHEGLDRSKRRLIK